MKYVVELYILYVHDISDNKIHVLLKKTWKTMRKGSNIYDNIRYVETGALKLCEL